MAIARRFHFHLLFQFHTMEQDILRTRTSCVSECFNVEPCGLSDRARSARDDEPAQCARARQVGPLRRRLSAHPCSRAIASIFRIKSAMR